MEVSSRCLALIKRFEGVRHQAYPDPGTGGAPFTIGVGHTGPEVHPGLVWDDAQVDAALAADVAHAAQGVTKLVGGAPTTQGQFDAMVSLAFNIGLGNFAKSSVLLNHKAGKPGLAAICFKYWTKGGGKVLPGLVDRRAAEAKLYQSG